MGKFRQWMKTKVVVGIYSLVKERSLNFVGLGHKQMQHQEHNLIYNSVRVSACMFVCVFTYNSGMAVTIISKFSG